MRKFLLLGGLAALVCAAASPSIPKQEYPSRRAALRKNLDGVVVLFGYAEGSDEVFAPRQESNFQYLTGWTEPGAILLVTPKEEELFLPHHNAHRELYTGRRSSAEDSDAKKLTGFDTVLPVERFETELANALSEYENLYALEGAAVRRKLQSLAPMRGIGDAQPLIAKLRERKSAAEIAAIQKATDVSIAGHRAVWKRIEPGIFEYQLAATFIYAFRDQGCEGYAYEPIVGSGPNGAILHYDANSRRMETGDLVVMDMAAECDGYASDITRTIPVSGKFTPRQRELYDIVLGAQKAGIAAVKPGVKFLDGDRSPGKAARDYIESHGKDLHGAPLGKYFTHGIGHHVGLDVHDPSINDPLAPGMVVTIEPGLYIPEEKLGIRIEDIVLVTEKGSKVLSAALPKEPEEVEKALAR